MRQFIALQIAWFAQQDRESILPATIASILYNVNRNPKKTNSKTTLDFMPDNPYRAGKEPQTPAKQCEILEHITLATGGRVKYIQADGNEYTGKV